MWCGMDSPRNVAQSFADDAWDMAAQHGTSPTDQKLLLDIGPAASFDSAEFRLNIGLPCIEHRFDSSLVLARCFESRMKHSFDRNPET